MRGDPVRRRDLKSLDISVANGIRGAKREANDQTTWATSGYLQPLSLRRKDTPGHIQHYQGTFRKCLLSSRSAFESRSGRRSQD